MRVVAYSVRKYEESVLEEANREAGHDIEMLEASLNETTAALAADAPAVALFSLDDANAQVIRTLAEGGTRLLALRSAGFNHVDLEAAAEAGITVARVPAYSPYAVAEHAVALILTLNRKTHRAITRTREQNFSLDGLMGFDLHGKTVGVIGTGKIGRVFCRIMLGFGCRVLAFDIVQSDEAKKMGVEYVNLDRVYTESDIISLNCPLNPKTHHLINDDAIGKMKRGVMLINTSRGGVIDTKAAIRGLKSRHIGSMGLDVYEEEGDIFFRDLSEQVIQDDVFARLSTFPNVVITAHQAFFTKEAITNIADTTIENISAFDRGGAEAIASDNIVRAEEHVAKA
ncbi:MAG: 2-hydroxyacid dehydrogenase [Phycisphaeraceae bacterium]|nr:MAG: 2-hydroxyacid dehydrogenase [Phycisphaeraceae bacterium]